MDKVVREIVIAMKKLINFKLLIVSGRDSVCRDETSHWLCKNHIAPFDGLFMRPEGDNRKDTIVKREIYEQFIEPHYDVFFVLDDRPCVIRMWRSLGLKVLDCGDGVEF